jgi:sporulation protein YlmC with PRC-barrel domain
MRSITSAPSRSTGRIRIITGKVTAVAKELQFAIGAKASCTDGSCGEVRRLVIDPAADTVTHLVIQPGHRKDAGRLVPVHLVDTAAGEIRLRCTRAEFDKLDPAEESDVVEGPAGGGLLGDALVHEGNEGYAPMGPGEFVDVGPQPIHRRVITQDVVPQNEIQLRHGDRVHAVDGEIGRVQGFLADPNTDQVTHVLLQEGHLWGRKEVAIPISAVTGVEDGIRLSITKQQVEDLPPVDIDHSS